MSLTGSHAGVGDIILTAGDGIGNGSDDGPLHSPGAIAELGDDLIAESFFDVFFELDLVDLGIKLHNNVSHRMEAAQIYNVPPLWIPYNFPGTPPVGLFDENNVYSGYDVTGSDHILTPEIDAASGLSALVLLLGVLMLMGERFRRPEAEFGLAA